MLKVGRKRKRKERKKEKNTQTGLPGFELALLSQLFNSFACLKTHHAAKKTKYKTRSISEYYTYIHTYTLLMLPKWAFQLNRIKNTNLYKLIKNVSTIIL